MRDWLAPALVGEYVESGDDLQQRLAHFKGNHFAKGALDTAWWVLRPSIEGQPLHRLLGAKRDAVDVGADFGVQDSIGELLAKIGPAVDAGFKRIKLKYRPGWDVRMLEAVRREFPTQTFHIDCNSGYTLNDFEMFCRLDDFNLAMIEQPLAYDDLVDHARLQEAIRTPICLDESINSVNRVEQALDLGSCKWVNIKPGRVGGLTVAVKIHNLCKAQGVGCWVGGMLESRGGGPHLHGLGDARQLHLSGRHLSLGDILSQRSRPAGTDARPPARTAPRRCRHSTNPASAPSRIRSCWRSYAYSEQ